MVAQKNVLDLFCNEGPTLFESVLEFLKVEISILRKFNWTMPFLYQGRR